MTNTTGPGEFGRGRTILVLAVVVACFAVLWPKVFYPMFTASIYPSGDMDDNGHIKPERFRPEMVHPALREKGRAIPTPTLPRRTIEREARPGPVPGVRPPVGGAGHVPNAPKGSGTMGIIMPMYTIGIVCFFVYTLMKILFKKSPDEAAAAATTREPILKDYGMDPEHRKFVFAEEYTDSSEKSMKDAYNKEDRELGVRRKSSGGKGRFHEDKRRLELETDPAEGEQNLVESESVEQIDTPKEPMTFSPLDELEKSTSETPQSQIHKSESEVESSIKLPEKVEPSEPVVEILTQTFETSPQSSPQTTSTICDISQPDSQKNKVSEDETTVEPTEHEHTSPQTQTFIQSSPPTASETSDLKLIENSTSSSSPEQASIPETQPTTVCKSIDPKILGGVTEEDLTSAALFFDRTIEIPEEIDFECNETLPKPEAEDEAEIKSFPEPTAEIVEFATTLAEQILEDATSTIATSNVFLLSLQPSDNPPVDTADDQPITLIIPTPALETIPTDIEMHDTSKSFEKLTDANTHQSNQDELLECITISVPLNTIVEADTITDDDTNFVEVEPAKDSGPDVLVQVEHENVTKVEFSEKLDIKPAEKCSEQATCNLDSQSEPVTPVVTLADDDVRKNSEPILPRQISDVQITPVEDMSGDQIFPDVLGGYVTMADEGKYRPPKGLHKHFRSGVEITSFDDGLGVESLKNIETVHRVMSMDSNDSVETVKDLSLATSSTDDTIIDLKIKEDHFGESNDNDKVDTLGQVERILADVEVDQSNIPEVKATENVEELQSGEPNKCLELKYSLDSLPKPETLAVEISELLTDRNLTLTIENTTNDNIDNETLVVDISNVLETADNALTMEPLVKENEHVNMISSNDMPFVEESASTTISDPTPTSDSTVEIPSPVEIQNEPESLSSSQLESTTNEIILPKPVQSIDHTPTEIEVQEVKAIESDTPSTQDFNEREKIIKPDQVIPEEIKTEENVKEEIKKVSQEIEVEAPAVTTAGQEPSAAATSDPTSLTEMAQKVLKDSIQPTSSEIKSKIVTSEDESIPGESLPEGLVEQTQKTELPEEIPISSQPITQVDELIIPQTTQEFAQIPEEQVVQPPGPAEVPSSLGQSSPTKVTVVPEQKLFATTELSLTLESVPTSQIEKSPEVPEPKADVTENKLEKVVAYSTPVEEEIRSTPEESAQEESKVTSKLDQTPAEQSTKSAIQIESAAATTFDSISVADEKSPEEKVTTPIASTTTTISSSPQESDQTPPEPITESAIQIETATAKTPDSIPEAEESPQEKVEAPISSTTTTILSSAAPNNQVLSSSQESSAQVQEPEPKIEIEPQEDAIIPQEKNENLSVSASEDKVQEEPIPEESQIASNTPSTKQEVTLPLQESSVSEQKSDSKFLPLEFEPVESEESSDLSNIIASTLAEELTPAAVSAAKTTSSVVACEFEIEFVPPAESQNVPPVQPARSSPLQPAVVALDTTSLALEPENKEKEEKEETIISEEIRVDTPEQLPSAINTFTTTITSEPLQLTSDIDKQVGVAIDTATTTTIASTFEIELIDDSLEDNRSAKRDEILGENEGAQDAPVVQPSTGESPFEKAAAANTTTTAATTIDKPSPVEKVNSGVSGTADSRTDDVPAKDEAATEIMQPGVANKDSGQRDRDARDIEIDMLRKRLEETEAAMERIVATMGHVSDRISPSILAQVLKAQGVRQEDSARRKDPEPILSRKSSSEGKGSLPSSMKKQPSVEKEVKFQLPPKDSEEEEDEPEEEEEIVRPPTPPRTLSKKSKHQPNSESSVMISKFAQELSETILQQSAAAAIAAAKAQGQQGPGGHRETVSVVGFEETAELESGEKWGDRTPTPTFRNATPPVPHRPPTPPEDIPSIFLEGPMPTSGQKLIVSDSQVEVEGGDLYDEDADYDNYNAPVVLSGKVTLSVISGLGDGAPDEITDAPSLSYEDKAQAGNTESNNIDRSKKDGLASAIKAEKGLSSSKKSPASSPDMEDYEVIKKGGFSNYDEEDNDDVDITSYMTAEADNDDGPSRIQEDTAGDISVMEGLEDGKNEELPKDEKEE